MRATLVISSLMLLAAAGFTRAEPPGVSPSAAADHNAASWAEWEAQARVTDGDYDGAVQAEKQAEAARNKVAQQQMTAGAVKRP